MVSGGALVGSRYIDVVVIGIGPQRLLPRDISAAKATANPARIRIGNLLLQGPPQRQLLRVQLIQIIACSNQLGPFVAGVAGLEQESARQLMLHRQCPLLRVRRAAIRLDEIDALSFKRARSKRSSTRWDRWRRKSLLELEGGKLCRAAGRHIT